MNKKIFIGISIVLFLILAMGGYFFWKLLSEQTPESVVIPAETNQSSEKTEKKPATSVTQTAKEGSILVSTRDNSNISVIDFFKNKKTIVYPDWGASIKDDPDYSLLYFNTDKSFLISLSGGDLHTVRLNAEKELVANLGITREDACQLKVATTVSCGVNEKACGVDYGLSFCPAGKPLPKNL